MEYSNPEIPEGINTSQEHPLKDFLILTSGVLGALFLAVTILALLAEKLAVYIPFEVEQKLVSNYSVQSESEPEISNHLQSIADQLTRHMTVPEGMQFTVHYIDEPVKNAYATLGGHIYIYQGIIDLLTTENALAMVIAHEMGHIVHRHPVIAMGRGVVIGLLLSTISGLSGDRFVGQVVSSTGVITLLNFTRNQERQSDRTALAAIAAEYGHVNGADELFQSLLELKGGDGYEPPRFLNTHPLTADRIESLRQFAEENNWSLQGDLSELPAIFKKNLKQD